MVNLQRTKKKTKAGFEPHNRDLFETERQMGSQLSNGHLDDDIRGEKEEKSEMA